MLSLERMRAAIDKSGYSAQAVFDRLSCGRGMVMRMDLATLARKLEPGVTDDQLNRLWYQTGKTRGGALSLLEFVRFFGDGPNIAQLPGGLVDLLSPREPMQAPFSPKAAWPPMTPLQDLPPSHPAEILMPMSPAGQMSMLDLSQSESAGIMLPNMNFWQSLMQPPTAVPVDQNTNASPQQTNATQVCPGCKRSCSAEHKFCASCGMALPQVANDWVECVDPQTGRTFFHSAREGRSSWTDPRPAPAPTSLPTETLASDWVEHVEPGTGRKFYYSAQEGRSSWTDPRPTPSVERNISDDRFKQLMDYFNQMVQARGHTATVWFEFVDIDKDGLLSAAEFRKGLADLGVHGVEQEELQLVLKRMGGSGPGSAYVSVDSVVRAITEPTGFLAANAVSSIQSAATIADSRCTQLLDYVNQILLSRGYNAAMYFDYIDLNKDGYLTSAEFVKGLTDLGVDGVDPTELHLVFQRVAGSVADGAFVHVSSLVQAVTEPAGFLSRVPGNTTQAAAFVEKTPVAIDDTRFIQLLDYCRQVLASRGQTALGHLTGANFDRDGLMSSAELVKVLRDLGLREGIESVELRQVFQRVAGSDSDYALVSSLAAAISDPAGFLAGNVQAMQPVAPAIVESNLAAIDDARFIQLLDYCKQMLLSQGQTALGHLSAVDLDRDGRLSSMDFIKVLRDLGLREGIESAELRKVFRRIEGSGTDSAYALVSSLAAAISDPAGFVAGNAHGMQPVALAAIDNARFSQLLDYCKQTLLSRGQTALGYLSTYDLDRDGRLSSMEFIKVLRDLGLREGIESTELRQVFQRIEGSGPALVSSLATAISDPAGFLAGNKPVAPQASLPKQRRLIVQLRTSPLKKLGFGASRSSDGLALMVDRIDKVGLLAEWNLQQMQSSDRVQISDQIAEVNGLSASPEDMIRALQSQGLLTIVFVRSDRSPMDAFSNIQTGEQIIGDSRFKQLLDYFNQVLLSRGFTAVTYFEAIDISKTGCLSVAEFIQSLTDLGINGIDHTELQKVFKRIEGSGLDSSQVFVSAIVDAVADPTGFIIRCGKTKLPDTEASLPTRKRMTVQLRPSALKKLGFGADQSDDGLTLFVKRIDIVGLLADWNAEQKRSRERVRVGDQITEVNGQIGNPKALARALQSPGLLTIVFTRLEQEAAEAKKKDAPERIIDTSRFKQLLEYFSQVLLSRGYTAAPYFDGIDLNKDGYLSVAEFIKGWADLGVNGLDRAELKNVLQRIKGGGLESAQARVNDIIDAINDPAGFIARGGAAVQSPAAQAGVSSLRRINVQLRPSGLKKLGLGCSLSDDGSQLLVKRIDVSGLLADWNAGQKRSSERVRVGDRVAEVNGSANPDAMAKVLQSQGLLMIVFIRPELVAARPDLAAADSTNKVDAGMLIDDARFKQLLEYFNQVLFSRGVAALTYFEAVDLDKDGRLSSADFIKGLTDLGVNGVESAELQRVFQRIDGTGLESSQALVSSIADAIADPASFIMKAQALTQPPSAGLAIRKRITATLLPSAFKKFGLGVSQDGLALLVSRIDSIGVLADWNAEQKRSSDRVRVGDVIEQVNGQNANQDAIAKAMQAQGPLTIVFARREKTASEEKKKVMDDARFKELLEYIKQTMQFRGRTVSTYFQAADLDKDGRLTVLEFIKALTDLGIQGVEVPELQKMLQRIKGEGSDSVPVPLTSIVAAITDPADFILKGGKVSEPTPVETGLSSSGRTTIQLRPSFFKKLGLGMSPADDRLSLLISRIDTNGLVADWNAGQKLAPDRVQVGDQIVEVNGKSGNADELNRALQSQDLLTIVFVRRNKGPITAKSKMEGKQIIDDIRFKQLLMHFNALLMKRGQTASKYFQSLDMNRDGRLSSLEFLKGLTDLGISGTDRVELQKVFRRIEGSGSDMAHVLVSSVVDAFTNPAGAIAKTANSAGVR